MSEAKPLRVHVSFTVELSPEAVAGWDRTFGVEGRRAIAADVRAYFGNDAMNSPILEEIQGITVVS